MAVFGSLSRRLTFDFTGFGSPSSPSTQFLPANPAAYMVNDNATLPHSPPRPTPAPDASHGGHNVGLSSSSSWTSVSSVTDTDETDPFKRNPPPSGHTISSPGSSPDLAPLTPPQNSQDLPASTSSSNSAGAHGAHVKPSGESPSSVPVSRAGLDQQSSEGTISFPESEKRGESTQQSPDKPVPHPHRQQDRHVRLVAADLLPAPKSSIGLPELNPPVRKTSFFGLGRSGGGGLFSKKESSKPSTSLSSLSVATAKDELKKKEAPGSSSTLLSTVEVSKQRVARAAASKPAPRPWDEVTVAPPSPLSPFVIVPPTTASTAGPSTYSSPTTASPPTRAATPAHPHPVDAQPSTSSSSTGPATTSTGFSYTFDPTRFPLPPYPCLRASLLPIAVLATHVQKKAQQATVAEGKGTSPEAALASLFGKTRGESSVPWKARILVLTSFQATTTTLDGSAAPEKTTHGCLHLFKTEGSGGVEIGRMPLSHGLVVSLLDPGTPEGHRVGEGRKTTLSISAAEESYLGEEVKKGKVREGGVRGKDEKELGVDRRWIVQMMDEATLRAWLTEIKSLLIIQRAEKMGLGDVARAQKSAGIPFDGDLDMALAKLASSRVPPSAASITVSFGLKAAISRGNVKSSDEAQPSTARRSSEPSVDPSSSKSSSKQSSRAPSPDPSASLTRLSLPTSKSTSLSNPPPRKSSIGSVGSSIRGRFTRDPPLSTITSPILTSSSNPLVSHLTRNDPMAGGQQDREDPETSFERLEAYLKTEHGMSASSRARIEDGTYSRSATPPTPREETPTSAELEGDAIKARDFAADRPSTQPEGDLEAGSGSRRGSDDPHPFSSQHPAAIAEDPEDQHRPITFRASRSAGSSSKRDSNSSDASQGASTTLSEVEGSNGYFTSTGYLSDFLLERKPSVGSSSAGSQRTTSTSRSRMSHLPPPRPPPTSALPPTPISVESPDLPATIPAASTTATAAADDPTESLAFQQLRAENARLRAELALVTENARLRSELDNALRRASQLPPPPSASTNTLTPPTSSSSGHTSPTSPTFSTHHAQHQAQRSALRSMPPGPPPLGLPPPPPTTTQAKGAVTLAAPPTSAARKGRRGSEPILQGPGVGRGEMRRPSLGLETLPEVTVSPPTNTTTGVTGHGGNLAGYRPVSFRAELKKVRVQGEAPPAAATEE